jgi:hypothetical protein
MQLAATTRAQRLEPPVELEELTERLTEQAQHCHDHGGVLLRETKLDTEGTWQFNGAGGKLSRHALGQLCARLVLPEGGTVPASYLARCPSALAALNLNYWLAAPSQREQRILVRARETGAASFDTIRAILSDRYVPVDHQPLLESLQELAPRHHLTVTAWSLDDHLLTLRLLVQADHPASLTDPFRVGLHVSNSEVGLGAVCFSAFINRLACTNGLVVKVADLGGFHRRHLGRVGEFLPVLVQAALPRVLAEAEQAGYRLARLRERGAPRPVAAFVQQTARQLALAPEWVPRIVGLLEGETLYDLVNAFTRAAQLSPVAERVRIETMMSQFLRDGGDPF